MHSRKLFLLFTFLFFSISQSIAQDYLRDTTYFDKAWNKCTKADYRYYRLMVYDTVTMPPAKLIRIIDYYKSGIPQMEKYVLANDTSQQAGLKAYYDVKGRPTTFYLYNYKYAKKFFDKLSPYLAKIEPCDSNADLKINLYRNGHIKSDGFYLSDDALGNCSCRKICTWNYYNPYNKRIMNLYDYKLGKKDGRAYLYYDNGKLWKEKYYKDGKKTGVWKKYKYDGSLRRTIHIKGTA
ncbi:MAG: hypothetical protein P4L41_06715 [Flavipsychrobacter sp.]|nr:hypothetical protein [Flavipsychrobacter sp.]